MSVDLDVPNHPGPERLDALDHEHEIRSGARRHRMPQLCEREDSAIKTIDRLMAYLGAPPSAHGPREHHAP